MKKIKSFKTEFPMRVILFILIGLLAGIYSSLSLTLLKGIEGINKYVLLALLAFGIIYSLMSFLTFFVNDFFIARFPKLSLNSSKIKTNAPEIRYKWVDRRVSLSLDVFLYYFGGVPSFVFCLLIILLISGLRKVFI